MTIRQGRGVGCTTFHDQLAVSVLSTEVRLLASLVLDISALAQTYGTVLFISVNPVASIASALQKAFNTCLVYKSPYKGFQRALKNYRVSKSFPWQPGRPNKR